MDTTPNLGSLEKQLAQETFNFLSKNDKEFIIAFDKAIYEIGYISDSQIGNGFCWGRYMIIYKRAGVKNKQVAARIYIRENGIVLRLFFSNIDKHRGYIENANEFIRTPFTDEQGICQHCHNEKEGVCKFRKVYTVYNRLIEKCNGVVFEFNNPETEKLKDYIGLLKEFYAFKKGDKD